MQLNVFHFQTILAKFNQQTKTKIVAQIQERGK